MFSSAEIKERLDQRLERNAELANIATGGKGSTARLPTEAWERLAARKTAENGWTANNIPAENAAAPAAADVSDSGKASTEGNAAESSEAVVTKNKAYELWQSLFNASEADRRIMDNPYVGWATDDLTQANFAEAPVTEETSGLTDSRRRDADGAAQFFARESRLPENSSPEVTAEYKALLEKLDRIDEGAAYITTVEQSDELERERKEVLDQLHKLDTATGRDERAYDAKERTEAFFSGWGKGTAASYTNAAASVGNVLALASDKLAAASSKADRRIMDNPYVGWVTDDLTAANFAEAPVSEETSGLSDSRYRDANRMYDAADVLFDDSVVQTEKAKAGLNGAGKFALDAAKTGMDILTDTAVSLTGVPGLANMAIRVYGSASQQARLSGDDAVTAAEKGLKEALIEVATEKMAGPFEAIYGKTVFKSSKMGKAITKAVDKLKGSGIITWALDALGEGVEEGMSDILNTVADHMFGWDDGTKTLWQDLSGDPEQIIYDMLLGAFVGAIGSGAGKVTSAAVNRPSNSAPVNQNGAVQQTRAEADIAELLSGIPPQNAAEIAGDVNAPNSVNSGEVLEAIAGAINTRSDLKNASNVVLVDDNLKATAEEITGRTIETTNDAAMALYELRTKALIESEFRDAVGDGSQEAIRALLASVVNNPEQFALVNKYYGLIPTDITGAIAFAERVAAGETLAKQTSSPEAQKTASAPSELSGEQVVPPDSQNGKQTASERLNPPHEVESVLADMYLEAEERNNASAEAESALQQQENNDIIADSTPETQMTETVIEEAPQAAEESNAITPAAETQEAAIQAEEAPDVDTPELQGFSERQIEKFKTKPKIKLSKKDYAKVSQARSAKYAGLSSESIPMLEVFPIAEYGQVDVGYRYIVRNTSSDVFEVVGKYKITNKANIMEGTEHDTGRNAEMQRSNQIAKQENAAADKGRNRSDSRRAGHGDTDGRIYDVADGSEESAVLEYTDDIAGDSGAYLTSEEETQSAAEAEEEAVPEAVQEEVFSDAEIQEREEQRIRDMEREADEARYQEQRHEEKHSIRSSAEYAQQQRKAAAESEAAVKADAAETPAKQDMKSVFGDYAEERLGTFSEKLGNLTARQGTLTSVRNGKRVTGTSRITNGVEVLELAQKCISGEVSVADFKLAYDKLEGTNAGYLYAKEISEAFGALQGYFSSLNNTEHERVSPEKIGKDAIAAFQMLTHRAELAAEYKPTSKKLNAEIKHKKSKTTQTILGKIFGMQSTPDTFWKALGGFDRESNSAAYAIADEALQSNITEKRERSAGYGFFESLKKHKDYQAFAENKLMSGLKVGDLQVELTAQEAVALAHSLRSLREETNNYAYGTPKEICIERNGENVVLFSQTKDKAVDAYVLKSLESEAAKSLTGIAKEYSEALDAMFGYYEPKFTGAIKNVTGFEREKVKPGTYYPLMYDRSGAAKYDIAGALKSKFETLGFAQEREHVGDTLAILPAAKTVDSYIKSVSNYIAWAGFANKLNMLNANIDGTGSLLSVVSEAYSDKTAKMLEQYIEDVSGYSEKPESAFRQLLSRFAGAVITGRPTTAFSQLSSIYAVSGIIKPEAIRRAGIIFPTKQKHVNLDDGLLTDRERHGINDSTIMEVARNADSKIKTIIEKIPGGKTYLNLVGLADAYTTKQIYAAAWCDVELDYPNLRNSNPKLFDSLVESKFAEALLFSQSDADNVNNAYMYRTNSDAMKALTMFTGQPNKQLNMVMTAIGEYNAAKGDAKAKAGQALKEVVRGQVGAAVSYAMMNTIARLLLHKFYSYRDDDDEDKLSMKNAVLTVISDSISTLMGTVWLGDTIGDWLLSQASGGKLGSEYDIQVNGISQINDLRKNITNLIDAAAQGKPVAKISKDLAMSLASLTGVPLQGAYDFANAAALWGRDAYNAIVKGKGIKTDYDIARVLDNDAILTGKVTGKSFYERAVDALTGNGASEERKAAQEAIRELYDETGSNAVFPSQFNGMISDEIILDGKEKETYGDEMLELFYGNFERIYDTELYKDADTEYKQDIVESLNKYARDSVKRDYFEKVGEEYDSAFEELHDGTVKEESIPEYISYRAVLSSSENNRDYDTIDALIAEFDKLSDDVQGALKDKGGLNVDKLLYAGNFGIDSKDWFETKDIIKEGEETRGTTDEAKAISVYLSMKGKSDEEILEAIKSQITPDRGGKKPAVIRRIEAYNEVAGKRGNIGSWLLLIAQLEDADENGSVSKSDCELAWRNMGLSKKQIYAGISFDDFYNIVKTGSKSYAVNESLVPQYDDFYEALMPEKEKTRYVLSDSFK